MSIQHKDIPDAQLHEPKGVASAAIGMAYIADGLGGGSWQIPDYGEFGLVSDFVAASSIDHVPGVTDTPVQISFGPAQSTPDISLDALGVVTINTTGVYASNFTGRIGRTTGAGSATIMLRYTVNGTPIPYTVAETLDDGSFSVPVTLARLLPLTQGDTVVVEMMLDSGGVANGGLYKYDPVQAGWAPVPSAALRFSRVGIL